MYYLAQPLAPNGFVALHGNGVSYNEVEVAQLKERVNVAETLAIEKRTRLGYRMLNRTIYYSLESPTKHVERSNSSGVKGVRKCLKNGKLKWIAFVMNPRMAMEIANNASRA